jgi:plastocyanin
MKNVVKTAPWVLLLLGMVATATPAAAKARRIAIETTLVDGVVHWSPERIVVKRGERIQIVASHKLTGGFDFHGLYIPELDIAEQIDRNEERKVVRTVPKSLAPGEYKIGCQFHPAHVPATLVVK